MTAMKSKPVVKSIARKASQTAATAPATEKARRRRKPVNEALLRKLWQQGVPVKDIATTLSLAPSSVYLFVYRLKLGYKDRAKPVRAIVQVKKLVNQPSWRVRALALRARDWEPAAIAKQVGVGIAEVAEFLDFGR